MEQGGGDYFRRLCDGFGFICISVDRNLNIVFWNVQATRHFGRTPEEMIGKPYLDVLNEPDREATRQLFEASMADGTSRETEVKYPTEDGDKTTFVVIISPIRDESGQCIGASAGMRDITQRKRMSYELAMTRRMAALGRMSGAVAHHFNNILGGMLTSIDYVLASDSPRELRRTLRLLAQSIGRATRITNQLAAFAESENELVEWKALNPILDDFTERVGKIAKTAGVDIKTEYDAVDSDPYEAQRLMTVLDSIARNSIEAMGPGGTLTLSISKENDSAVIRVRDNGCGIPDDLQEHIFEPFFTTKGELQSGEHDNIGLGLAAVHGLVGEMGGTIKLKSKVGEGTVVVIRLPLHRSKST